MYIWKKVRMLPAVNCWENLEKLDAAGWQLSIAHLSGWRLHDNRAAQVPLQKVPSANCTLLCLVPVTE
jgi:hypothetical protein